MGFRAYKLADLNALAEAGATAPEVPTWSGNDILPAIGSRVRVTMNGLGEGTVIAYFIEERWMGIYVALSNPPAWWVKQTQQKSFVSNENRISGCAMVFGKEIEPVGGGL
jgi:hypothetical protein